MALPDVDLDPHGSPDVQTPTYKYIYDAYGNQVAILDPLERITVFEYDHLHRQVEKFMPFIYSGTLDTAANVYTALAAQSPQPDSETQSYYDNGQLKTENTGKHGDRHHVLAL